MQHRDYIVLRKIIEEIDVATDIIGDTPFNDFEKSETLKRSICMTAINIGELVKNLSSECRLKHKHIPWKSIAGFRDIAAHKYRSLFMDDVYTSVKKEFPELKENILKILSE